MKVDINEYVPIIPKFVNNIISVRDILFCICDDRVQYNSVLNKVQLVLLFST